MIWVEVQFRVHSTRLWFGGYPHIYRHEAVRVEVES